MASLAAGQENFPGQMCKKPCPKVQRSSLVLQSKHRGRLRQAYVDSVLLIRHYASWNQSHSG